MNTFESMNICKLMFVYGTLKKGFGNHRLLGNSKFVDKARTSNKYLMVSLVGFPGVLDVGDDVKGKTHISGELYLVEDAGIFHGLDCLEGYPRFYTRKVIEVITPTGHKAHAWMYLLTETDYYLRCIQVNSNRVVESGVWGHREYPYRNVHHNVEIPV